MRSSVHGCWLGIYERHMQAAITAIVEPGTVAFDVGAHAGFFTLLFSRRVGSGAVVAFEPNPTNLQYLNNHLQANHISNAKVIASAVSNRTGTARFVLGSATQMGRIDENGMLEVPSTSLDDFIASGAALPQYVKIDVEGAETSVLEGAERLLDIAKPVLFLATHGWRARESSFAILERHGYRVRPVGDSEHDFIARA